MPRSELEIGSPHGRCLIVELAEDEVPPLVGDERELAARLAGPRRREFAAGRAALRAALRETLAMGADDRGAPILPVPYVGSISHKGHRAAAIVADGAAGFVGVDLELAVPSRQPIERRILTPREQAGIEGTAVTLRFALKEAIYKAIDPIVRRYVGFLEVELDVSSDGTCVVHVVDPARLPVSIEAWWDERDGHFITTARARRA